MVWIFCNMSVISVDTQVICNPDCSSSILSTLVFQDLHLIWAALINSQKAKQLLSADWSYITLLNFVNFEHSVHQEVSHKQCAMLTVLSVVWAFWSFKIFTWSALYSKRNSKISYTQQLLPADWLYIKVELWNQETQRKLKFQTIRMNIIYMYFLEVVLNKAMYGWELVGQTIHGCAQFHQLPHSHCGDDWKGLV